MIKITSSADEAVTLTYKGKDITIEPGDKNTVDNKEEADFVVNTLGFCTQEEITKKSTSVPPVEEKKVGVKENKN